MKSKIVFILLIIIIQIYCPGNSKSTEGSGKKVKWESFNSGFKKAKKEKKSIIIDFYADWCHWCKVMDEKTFGDKDIEKKLIDRFIAVRINAESRTETATYKENT